MEQKDTCLPIKTVPKSSTISELKSLTLKSIICCKAWGVDRPTAKTQTIYSSKKGKTQRRADFNHSLSIYVFYVFVFPLYLRIPLKVWFKDSEDKKHKLLSLGSKESVLIYFQFIASLFGNCLHSCNGDEVSMARDNKAGLREHKGRGTPSSRHQTGYISRYPCGLERVFCSRTAGL